MSKSTRMPPRFEFEASVVPRVAEWVGEARALFARSEAAEPPVDWSLGLQDVIEGITVAYAARLVASLVNELESVRVESAGLLVRLAAVFAAKPLEQERVAAAVDAFKADESGFVDAVHGLMRVAGPALCRGALGAALVAAVEGYYAHADLAVQQAAIAANARLMSESADVFGADIYPAGVYALFFLLDVPPPPGAVAGQDPRRLAVVEGLGLLAPLYAASDAPLAGHVLARLLQAPEGGAREAAAARRALAAVFAQCAAGGAGLRAAWGALVAALSGQPAGEERLPLLAWAAAELLRAAPPETGPQGGPAAKALHEALAQVAQHCRAPSAALRYGAAVLLAALLHARPALVDESPEPVFFHVFVGCFDEDRAVRRLHLTVLAGHALQQSWRAVAGPLERYLAMYSPGGGEQEEEEEPPDAPAVVVTGGPPPERREAAEGLAEALALAARLGPKVDPRMLQGVLNGLPHEPLERQREQMAMAAMLAGRLAACPPLLVAGLLAPLLEASPDIRLAESAFAALAAAAPLLAGPGSEHALASVHAHAMRLLAAPDGALAPAVLAAAARLPLERLPAAPRAALLRALLRLAYHPSAPVRAAAYAAAGAARRLWTDELADLPTALLLLALADRHAPTAAGALEALEATLAERPPYGAVLATVRGGHAGLTARDDLPRLQALDAVANAVAGLSPQAALRTSLEDEGLLELVAADLARPVPVFDAPGPPPSPARPRPDPGAGGGPEEDPRPHLTAWAALLYTKLGLALAVTPEQQRALGGVARAGQPVPPLRLLRPALAHPSPAIRVPACVAVKRACFSADSVNFAAVTEVVELLVPSLLANASAYPSTPPLSTAAGGASASTPAATPQQPPKPPTPPQPSPGGPPSSTGAPSITLSPARPPATAAASAAADRSSLDEPHLAEAALFVLTMLVPFKIRGLNKLVCDQALDAVLALVEEAGEAAGRRAGHLCGRRAVELAEALLLACPAAFTDSVERLRDALRRVILFGPEEAGRAAERLYPLLFRAATGGADRDLARAFFTFARSDVQPALDPKWDAGGDHLLAHLAPAQLRVLAVASIDALAASADPALAGAILEEVTPLLRHGEAVVRLAALDAALAQFPQAEKAEALSEEDPAVGAAARAAWVALPLLADPAGEVRAGWRRHLAGLPTPVDHRAGLLGVDAEANAGLVEAWKSGARSAASRHAGAVVPPTPRPAALRLGITAAGFESGQSQSVPPKLLARPESPATFFYLAEPPAAALTKEELGPPPQPNSALLERMQGLLAGLHAAGEGTPASLAAAMGDEAQQAAVAYHLDAYRSLPDPLPGAALLVLSELASVAPATGRSALQTLLAAAARQVTPATQAQVLPAVVGLVNLCRASRELFDEALGVLGAAAAATEGQLLAMRALVPLVAQHCKGRSDGIATHYAQFLTRTSAPPETRRAAMELIGELAPLVAAGTISAIAERVREMLEQALEAGGAQGGSFEDQVLKFMTAVPGEHPIVHRLTEEAAACLPSAADERRAKAAVLFRVVARHMPAERAVYFVLVLLADPAPRLRERAVRLMADAAALGPALADALRALLAEAGAALLKAATQGGAPTAALVPMLTPPSGPAALEPAAGPLAARLSQWAGRVLASLLAARGRGIGTPGTPATPATPSAGAARGGIAGDGLPSELWGTRADPCNAALLSSPAALAAARRYGLPPSALRVPEASGEAARRMLAATAARGKGAAPSKEDEAAGPAAATGTLAPAALTAIAQEPAPVASLVMKGWAASAASALDTAQGALTADPAAGAHSPAAAAARVHAMQVLIALLRAADGVRQDVPQRLEKLCAFADDCNKRAEGAREAVFAEAQRAPFLGPRLLDLPLPSAEAHALRHAHRRRLEAAATDRAAHEELLRERGECRRAIDARHAELWRFSFAQEAAMQTAAAVYRSAAHMASDALLRGYGWFSRHMYHPHRGVRGIAVDALVGVAYDRAPTCPPLQAALARTVEAIRNALDADAAATAPLRRTKAHLVLALGRLLPLYRAAGKAAGVSEEAATASLRAAAVARLVRYWDDPDAAVRLAAIHGALHLAEVALPELLALAQPGAGGAAPLVEAIAARVKLPEYREKEPLNALLRWCFGRAAAAEPRMRHQGSSLLSPAGPAGTPRAGPKPAPSPRRP